MKHSLILSLFLAALTAIPAGVSAQQKTAPAPAKPAAPKPNPGMNPAEFNDKINAFRKECQINRWALDFVKFDGLLRKFMADNASVLNQGQQESLIRNIIMNAAKVAVTKPELFEAAYKLVLTLPENRQPGMVSSMTGSMLGPYNNPDELKASLRMFNEWKAKYQPEWLLRYYPYVAKQDLRFNGDFKAFRQYAADLQNVTFTDPKNDPKNIERFNLLKQEQFSHLVGALLEFDLAEGTKFFQMYEKEFGAESLGIIYKSFILAASNAQEREIFDTYCAKLKQLPYSDQKARLVIDIASSIRNAPEQSKRILEELINDPAISLPQKFNAFIALRRLVAPNQFNYGFHTPGSYEKGKAYLLEALKLADKFAAQTPGKTIIGQSQLAGLYTSLALNAYEFGDYAFADEMLAKAFAISPEGIPQKRVQIQILTKQKKDKEAVAVIDSILGSKQNINANEKNDLAVIRYFLNGGSVAGFDRAFADLKLNDEQKMQTIRKAGAFFFRAKRFELTRKLSDDVISTMFRPAETDRHYTVKYLPEAPKTAEAWARTPAYNDWKSMETRFAPYAGYDVRNDKEFLKSTSVKPLDDAYRTGLQAVFDESGLHIYLRCNDPKVQEIVLGKRNYGGLEWVFQPGQEKCYYSFHFSDFPGTEDPHYVNWAAPTKHYRLAYDGIAKDATITKDAVVAHVFIPWTMTYDALPTKEDPWKLGLQIWGPSTRSLSGLVHELARCIKLDFQFTPKQTTDLKRHVAIQMFNRYNKMRQNAGLTIQSWNDPVLGDPAFYDACLKDFIAELDKAGEKLMAPAPDSEIDAIYSKYVPLWAEIEYVINEKRAAYLRDRLFQQ